MKYDPGPGTLARWQVERRLTVRCVCGTERRVKAANLVSNLSKSCGSIACRPNGAPPIRRHKLNPESVAEIRRLYGSGACTRTELAEQFGVSPTTVGKVIRGELWVRV